jgi:hypothetical protein
MASGRPGQLGAMAASWAMRPQTAVEVERPVQAAADARPRGPNVSVLSEAAVHTGRRPPLGLSLGHSLFRCKPASRSARKTVVCGLLILPP